MFLLLEPLDVFGSFLVSLLNPELSFVDSSDIVHVGWMPVLLGEVRKSHFNLIIINYLNRMENETRPKHDEPVLIVMKDG